MQAKKRKVKTKNFDYHVRKDDELTLKIVSGYRQPSATIVSIGDEDLTFQDEQLESGIPLRVGDLEKGADLVGKVIRCVTTITKLKDLPEMTSVTYTLTGGNKDLEEPVTESFDFDGQIIIYSARFFIRKEEV